MMQGRGPLSKKVHERMVASATAYPGAKAWLEDADGNLLPYAESVAFDITTIDEDAALALNKLIAVVALEVDDGAPTLELRERLITLTAPLAGLPLDIVSDVERALLALELVKCTPMFGLFSCSVIALVEESTVTNPTDETLTADEKVTGTDVQWGEVLRTFMQALAGCPGLEGITETY